MNLFDINIEYTNSHFLHLKILKYASERLQYETDMGRGYVPINILKQEAEKVQTIEEAIDDSLRKLAKFNLIMFENQSPVGLETASYFKITTNGVYYLNVLSHRFSYLDLMWMDTPVADINLETELRHSIDRTDMSTRFERTDKFLKYLSEMERIDFETNPDYRLSELGRHTFMQSISKTYRMQKKYILSRLLEKRDIRSID